MKKQTFARGGEYSAPQIELYTAAVERGFQVSGDGSTIAPGVVENWDDL